MEAEAERKFEGPRREHGLCWQAFWAGESAAKPNRPACQQRRMRAGSPAGALKLRSLVRKGRGSTAKTPRNRGDSSGGPEYAREVSTPADQMAVGAVESERVSGASSMLSRQDSGNPWAAQSSNQSETCARKELFRCSGETSNGDARRGNVL